MAHGQTQTGLCPGRRRGAGALQAGALRALREAGYRPDLVVGTSIGAVNAAFLGMHGFNGEALDALEAAWHVAAEADLLPSNYLWLSLRALFGRSGGQMSERMLAFLRGQGVTPELCFSDLTGVPVRLVTTDINSGKVVLYGSDPEQSVLDGILASGAVPPWVHPLEREGRLLLDGGTLSNLPIEPALSQGAAEIIALDISDMRPLPEDASGVGPWVNKTLNTIAQRQLDLELELAAARRVPVRLLRLRFEHPVPIWDFKHTRELIATGYALTKAVVADWKPQGGRGDRTIRQRLCSLDWGGRKRRRGNLL